MVFLVGITNVSCRVYLVELGGHFSAAHIQLFRALPFQRDDFLQQSIALVDQSGALGSLAGRWPCSFVGILSIVGLQQPFDFLQPTDQLLLACQQFQ